MFGVALVLGGCSTFVAAEGSAETGGSSGDETGNATLSTSSDDATATTSGVDTNGGSSGTTTPDPTATGTPTTDPTGPATSTGGGESTGGSSTGFDPTGESSTGDPPASCGDGIPHPSEDCDDGNADELDGCTTSCSLGPTGIDYGAIVTSGLGGGSGTNGISDNTHECPPNQVLVGLQGDLTTEPWIGVIGGICRPTALTNTDPPGFATGGPSTELPQHGGFTGGGPWITECGADEVIVAVQGGAGTVVDGLQIQCASIDTVGPAGAYSLAPSARPGYETLQGGDGGGSFGPVACPPGSVASGLRSRTNSYVIQVELRCRELDLTY